MERIYHIKPTGSGTWKCCLAGGVKVLFTSPTREETEELAIAVARKLDQARVLVFDSEDSEPRERLFSRRT